MSAPLAKVLVSDAGPVALASLFYLSAGGALALVERVRGQSIEAPLRRADVPVLMGVTLTGGVLAPVLMLIGLSQVSGVAGALLLNLEAPFTMLVAVGLFGEHLGRREALAAGAVVVGGALLTAALSGVAGSALGALALAGACMAWAIDNNLTQRLSLRDPVSIVRTKALGAGATNLLLALLLGDPFPHGDAFIAALVLGALSYGLSIVLDTYALRSIGAAREAAYFATAPFFGAALAILVLGESIRMVDMVAAAAMALGIALLLRERHGHHHLHEDMTHEHVHTHDEHHHHDHEPGLSGDVRHSHLHTHAPLSHAHPHVSDAHHRHRH